MGALDTLVRNLGHAAVGWEIAALLGCLSLAYGICWALGRRHAGESVFFGRAIVDGVLFPLVALGLTYTALVVLARYQSVALLHIAVPMLVSLAGIRFLARVLAMVFPASRVARLLERVFSWVAWLAAVLWILNLLPPVIAEMESIHLNLGKSQISLMNVVEGVLSVGVVLVITLWISAALEKQVLRQAVHDLSLRKVAANTIRAALLVVGVLMALSAVGMDLTAFSVLGVALGVGLGFGLQKLASNYVSGFVILFERSLRIGDTVRVDNFEGQVMDIKTRYTLIRSANGRESIVPNEKLITERIENLSLADPLILLTSDITVGYDSDVATVQKILCEATRVSARVLRTPEPSARLVKFGADGLEFSLLYWIADPANGQLNVRSDVNIAILDGLREAGIDIPYPQRVLHIKRAANPT